MKNLFLTLVILFCTSVNITFAADRYSVDYLKNHKHFAIMNPMAESIIEKAIKSSLHAETSGKYNVKFTGYTLSSMQKGIFKYLEISGRNSIVEGITIPYVHLVSLSDYNYIDYKSTPIKFKSDMKFAYDMELDENTINTALAKDEYKKVTNKVNQIAYPLFMVTSVRTKIVNNRLYVIISYNFPIAKISKDKFFVSSTDLKVVNGRIIASDVKLDSAYGSVSLTRVANLINLLNPLEFAIDILDSKKCDANIENVNIVDNKVKVDGKIYIKGE